MRLSDPPILRRLGALLILLVLFLAFWFGPISMYLELVGQGRDEIARREALLQRYRVLAQASAPAAPATAQSALLMPDLPDSQAAALLQETIKTAAAGARVEIRGIQMLAGETVSGALRLGMRIRAAGDAAALGRLLHAIETARPLLIPDNLQVQSRMASPGAPPAPLEFQLDVSGFKPAS